MKKKLNLPQAAPPGAAAAAAGLTLLSPGRRSPVLSLSKGHLSRVLSIEIICNRRS